MTVQPPEEKPRHLTMCQPMLIAVTAMSLRALYRELLIIQESWITAAPVIMASSLKVNQTAMCQQIRIAVSVITHVRSPERCLIIRASWTIARPATGLRRLVRVTTTFRPRWIAICVIPPQPSSAARGSTIPARPADVINVTPVVAAQPPSQMVI